MNDLDDPKWHFCQVSEAGGKCDYKTKNSNAMRVHLRTEHQIYYCNYCRARWLGSEGQKQMWKRHMDADCRKPVPSEEELAARAARKEAKRAVKLKKKEEAAAGSAKPKVEKPVLTPEQKAAASALLTAKKNAARKAKKEKKANEAAEKAAAAKAAPKKDKSKYNNKGAKPL